MFGIKLGLENMRRLSAALSHPENHFETIHVAGSNGKGSVSTKVAKAYEAEGHRVGLYTSPHISSFRERITINGKMISEEAIEEILPKIFEVVEAEKIPATFFEVTTLLAFMYYQQENVDLAVIETGLGGRLDATNVITPKLSIITSISIEHADVLGSTLEAIAKEKGGIIKPGVPVVIGPRVPANVIQSIAATNGSQLVRVNQAFENFHEENKAVARAALELLCVSENAIIKGLVCLPPCRMERIETDTGTFILDAAHNPDGIESLFKALPQQKYKVILGLSKNKDVEGCLSVLKSHVSSVNIVTSTNGRGLDIDSLQKRCAAHGINSRPFTTISAAIQDAQHTGPFPVLVCGTFFILAEARLALGIQEPIDELSLNEHMLKTESRMRWPN